MGPVGEQDAWEAGSGTGPPPGRLLGVGWRDSQKVGGQPVDDTCLPQGGLPGPCEPGVWSPVSSGPPSGARIWSPALCPGWPESFAVHPAARPPPEPQPWPECPSLPGSAPGRLSPSMASQLVSVRVLDTQGLLGLRPPRGLSSGRRGPVRPRLLIFRLYVFRPLTQRDPLISHAHSWGHCP